jgi:hypothetical protein
MSNIHGMSDYRNNNNNNYGNQNAPPVIDEET